MFIILKWGRRSHCMLHWDQTMREQTCSEEKKRTWLAQIGGISIYNIKTNSRWSPVQSKKSNCDCATQHEMPPALSPHRNYWHFRVVDLKQTVELKKYESSGCKSNLCGHVAFNFQKTWICRRLCKRMMGLGYILGVLLQRRAQLCQKKTLSPLGSHRRQAYHLESEIKHNWNSWLKQINLFRF